MAAAGSSEQHAAEPMAVDAGRAADGGGQRERTAQQQQQQPPQPPQPPRKKKEKATERAYTLDELRTGLRLMIKRNVSKVGAAVQIGHPSAASTLGRYAKRLRRDGELLRNTPRETEAARLEAIDELLFKSKENPAFNARKMFSRDALDFFAAAIKLTPTSGSRSTVSGYTT